MATEIGPYLISTVGDFRPSGPNGAKDTIGHNRYFETMVFRLSDELCDCGCRARAVDEWSEIDFAGYQTAAEAHEGHMKLCRKWAAVARRTNRRAT
jgi:hypothetical protein